MSRVSCVSCGIRTPFGWFTRLPYLASGRHARAATEPIYFFSNHLSLSCTSFPFKQNLKNTQAARDGSLRGGATTALITERTLLGGPHFFFWPLTYTPPRYVGGMCMFATMFPVLLRCSRGCCLNITSYIDFWLTELAFILLGAAWAQSCGEANNLDMVTIHLIFQIGQGWSLL